MPGAVGEMVEDRREQRRRVGSRGGRRRGDKGLPWWRGGLAFAALCVGLKCWGWMRRNQASRPR